MTLARVAPIPILLLLAAFAQRAVARQDAASQVSPARDAAGAGAPVTISVVATTDLHGRIESLPWLSGHVANLEAARAGQGGAVLLVDSGDMFQGTLESNLGEGAAVVRGYNALGYAAAAIGNHEFDFGPAGPAHVPGDSGADPRGAIKARAREAQFPLPGREPARGPTNRRPHPLAQRAALGGGGGGRRAHRPRRA